MKTKYSAIALITTYYLFVTYVVNSIGQEVEGGIITPEPIETTPSLLTLLSDIWGYMQTFFNILTFNVPDVPKFISLTFVVCAIIMVTIIISIIRGVE